MNELVFFVEKLKEVKDSFVLEGEEAHHISHVLRLKAGKKIFLIDGEGRKYYGEIMDIQKKSVDIRVLEKEILPAKEPRISVAIGPVKKREANEWMVEKLTELGINAIHFFYSANSERARIKMDRVRKIAVSACKQSLNPFLPELNELKDFKSCISQFKNSRSKKLIAYCGATAEDFILLKYVLPEDCIIFIGPEGGFSKDEVSFAQEKGFETISLGSQRLRTETAAIFAVSAINSKLLA